MLSHSKLIESSILEHRGDQKKISEFFDDTNIVLVDIK